MHAAPVTRFAFAFAAGAGWGLIGAPLWTAPLLALLFLASPNRASRSPTQGRLLACVALMGALAAASARPGTSCLLPVVGSRASLEGRFVVTPRSGSAPFERADGCGLLTVVMPSASDGERDGQAGRSLVVTGTWREGARRPWFQAQTLSVASQGGRGSGSSASGGAAAELRWGVVRWRDSLVGRLHRLYGPRAPLVTALTLARREGMDRGVREAFAATGIAHLLAISGFHVGIIAGLALVLLRALGARRRPSELGAAGLSWAYVALIGFPDAACRAALILAFVAVSRARGRPPSRWGALAAAAIVLLVLDASKLASPGFQLSFAGAGGLVAWARPLGAAMHRRLGRRMPRSLVSGLAAGVAATLATLPIVAWHFERVSLVGIPMTLIATPLVSLALPGALASLAIDFVSPELASLLAGGVSVLLDALVGVAEFVAAWPGVSVWTSRGSVVAAVVGFGVATGVARRPGVGARGRRGLVSLYVTTAIIAWPMVLSLESRGSLELLMIDVGQGDAIAIRTPAGRWLLVDAGPPADGAAFGGRGQTRDERRERAPDHRGHPVVRALRNRGVDRLEMLVLTHPDLDHIGGAAAVLSTFAVGQVIDPAIPVPKSTYADVLDVARRRGVPWMRASAGQVFHIDGVTLRILHPFDGTADLGDANASSVVMLVSWRGFNALLTGDAYVDVERRLIDEVGDIDVLKVGHHGSDTSTDSLFLAHTRPEVALISVGRRNGYGHPSPDVMVRLRAAGATVHRTDQEGTVRVTVRRDGTVRVRSERGGRSARGGGAGRPHP